MSTSSNSSSTSAPTSSASKSSPAQFSVGSFVFHVDILILALITLVVLARLPRGIARLWRFSEWSKGHFLRYTENLPPAPSAVVLTSRGEYKTPKELASDDSHTSFSHMKHARRVTHKGAPVTVVYPPHIASCMPFLRPIMTSLRSRISPGFSVTQIIALVIYLAVLVYTMLYKSTGPFTDPDRAGWVAISQLPFIFAFSAKNNVLGAFLGFGYEKLNFFHRFVGRAVVVAINIHGLGHFYKWSLDGDFVQHIRTPSSIWGLVGLVCVDLLAIFSTAFWRQKAYHVFTFIHVVCFSVVMPALWFHKPSLRPFVIAALGIYAFDQLFRVLKTRFHNAIIRPLPELGVTRIEIPQVNSGWRAGQHVRIRAFTSAMGWWGWTESHPFTIASVSGSHEGMVLMCKKTGNWTTRLFEFAKSGGYNEAGVGRNMHVMIEGPYGGPGHAIFSSYSAAVFVTGGSGISFALSCVQDLINQDLKGRSRVKVIELIWVVQDPAALVPLVPQFTAMIQQSVFTPVRISVFYTRAPIGKFPFPPNFFPLQGLTLSPGRPRISNVLEAAISRAVRVGAGAKDSQRITGMIVPVCGPVGLADEVCKAVAKVDPLRRDQVGGIELHEEVFGL